MKEAIRRGFEINLTDKNWTKKNKLVVLPKQKERS